MSTGKSIAGDIFTPLHTFQEKGVARTLRDAQVGTDRREQVRGKYVVHREEISLFREALELLEVWLNHG